MKKNEDNRNDFYNEKCLNYAVPLVKAAKSWTSMEDAGKDEKATLLHFDALVGKQLYMANAVSKDNSGYVRLYITNPGHSCVWSVYVKRDILYDEERYHPM